LSLLQTAEHQATQVNVPATMFVGSQGAVSGTQVPPELEVVEVLLVDEVDEVLLDEEVLLVDEVDEVLLDEEVELVDEVLLDEEVELVDEVDEVLLDEEAPLVLLEDEVLEEAPLDEEDELPPPVPSPPVPIPPPPSGSSVPPFAQLMAKTALRVAGKKSKVMRRMAAHGLSQGSRGKGNALGALLNGRPSPPRPPPRPSVPHG
jgi:hypothetical protein